MLTVAGLGNRFRGDDGVGLALVDWLTDCRPAGVVTCYWEDADALTLTYFLLSLAGPVLLVDSAEMELSPGVGKLMSRAEVLLHEPLATVSSHGFGIATALILADALGFKQPVWFFGVQPACFLGETLSISVQKNWDCLSRDILAVINQLNGSCP